MNVNFKSMESKTLLLNLCKSSSGLGCSLGFNHTVVSKTTRSIRYISECFGLFVFDQVNMTFGR